MVIVDLTHIGSTTSATGCQRYTCKVVLFVVVLLGDYNPLVNIQKTMENHNC
jgi:hypothetical protein